MKTSVMEGSGLEVIYNRKYEHIISEIGILPIVNIQTNQHQLNLIEFKVTSEA